MLWEAMPSQATSPSTRRGAWLETPAPIHEPKWLCSAQEGLAHPFGKKQPLPLAISSSSSWSNPCRWHFLQSPMLVELYCLLHSSTALMAKICLLFLAKRSFPSQRSNLDLLALRGRLLLELYMKPGSFLLVVMLLHLSLCFLASVSYQWSEQIATASMPRAHRAKERPAYSSNLPAAIPQLHRNTMGIFTTGKALERETTPNPPEQLLGVTRQRLPQTSPTRAAHIHAAGGRPERYKVLPWGQSWGLICLCSSAEETWRGETQPPTSSEPATRLYKGVLLPSPRAPELWGLKEQPPPMRLESYGCLISPLISFSLTSWEIQEGWLSDPEVQPSIAGQKSSAASSLPR